MAGIYSIGGSAGHRYAGWLETVEAKNFQFGGKVFNGSPSAIYVGSNQVWPWLTIAAQQAIRGAFGQTDGKAVIKATNAYLNQLAASDRDKATALAGFINEDPMMVCSLGLEVEGVTMPIRWLVGDGNAYINTGIVMKNLSHIFEVTCQWDGTNSGAFETIFGFMHSSITPRIGLHQYSGSIMIGTNNTNTTSYPVDKVARDYIYNAASGDVSRRTVGDSTYSYIGNAGNGDAGFDTNTLPIFLFARNYGGHNNGYVGKIAKFKDNADFHFIPCKHPTQGNGMLDLVNVVFYPNAGTGQFTIPDISYTPSTP